MLFICKDRSGFTLIELLVVIAIIGILSSVVLASLSSARTKARDAKRTSDIRSVQTALELYYDAKGEYPKSPDVTLTVALASYLVPDYLSSIPDDPVPGYDYRYYNANATSSQYYAIRIPYEGKPKCFVCKGNSTCAQNAGFWSLPMCD